MIALWTTRTPRASVEASQSSGERTEAGVACVVTPTMAPGNTRPEVRLVTARMER